jgi:branched-chain amino acid aminotransferase
MKIYMNGKMVPESEATISVFDHGLLYGDGIFEGIRSYSGRIFELEAHIDRLFDSAKAIALEMPMGRSEMMEAVALACRENNTTDGYIRVVVTRGVGTLGLNPYLCDTPQVIIIAADIQLYPKDLYENGLSIVTVGTTRNLPEALNPRIKSLNYLNNILAKIEAINAGCMEAIMLNSQGAVAEATGDNIFAVCGDVLRTPPVNEGILQGITRDVVMKLALEAGLTVREERLSRYDLYTADEVFLTGTAAEVIGVVNIDRRQIGDGVPGPVTCRLVESYREYASSNGYPIGN